MLILSFQTIKSLFSPTFFEHVLTVCHGDLLQSTIRLKFQVAFLTKFEIF